MRRSNAMPGEYGPTALGRRSVRTGVCEGRFIMGSMSSLTRLLNIRHPVLQSGMGRVAGPDLAAEVSRAGGLGILAGLNVPPDDLRAQIRRVRELTDAPFGVNLWLHPEVERPIDPARIAPSDLVAVNAALNPARRAVGLAESTVPPPPRPDLLLAA